MVNADIEDCGIGVSDSIVDSFAKLILPDILTYFASEEGQREFEEWLQKTENSKS